MLAHFDMIIRRAMRCRWCALASVFMPDMRACRMRHAMICRYVCRYFAAIVRCELPAMPCHFFRASAIESCAMPLFYATLSPLYVFIAFCDYRLLSAIFISLACHYAFALIAVFAMLMSRRWWFAWCRHFYFRRRCHTSLPFISIAALFTTISPPIFFIAITPDCQLRYAIDFSPDAAADGCCHYAYCCYAAMPRYVFRWAITPAAAAVAALHFADMLLTLRFRRRWLLITLAFSPPLADCCHTPLLSHCRHAGHTPAIDITPLAAAAIAERWYWLLPAAYYATIIFRHYYHTRMMPPPPVWYCRLRLLILRRCCLLLIRRRHTLIRHSADTLDAAMRVADAFALQRLLAGASAVWCRCCRCAIALPPIDAMMLLRCWRHASALITPSAMPPLLCQLFSLRCRCRYYDDSYIAAIWWGWWCHIIDYAIFAMITLIATLIITLLMPYFFFILREIIMLFCWCYAILCHQPLFCLYCLRLPPLRYFAAVSPCAIIRFVAAPITFRATRVMSWRAAMIYFIVICFIFAVIIRLRAFVGAALMNVYGAPCSRVFLCRHSRCDTHIRFASFAAYRCHFCWRHFAFVAADIIYDFLFFHYRHYFDIYCWCFERPFSFSSRLYAIDAITPRQITYAERCHCITPTPPLLFFATPLPISPRRLSSAIRRHGYCRTMLLPRCCVRLPKRHAAASAITRYAIAIDAAITPCRRCHAAFATPCCCCRWLFVTYAIARWRHFSRHYFLPAMPLPSFRH